MYKIYIKRVIVFGKLIKNKTNPCDFTILFTPFNSEMNEWCTINV